MDVALAKLASSVEGASSLKLVSVDKAQKQVVAGLLYHIDVMLKEGKRGSPKKCTLKIWYQLWISEEPRSVEGKCEDNTTYSHARVTRSAVFGGESEIPDPQNNEQIQSYLNSALVSYNSGQYGAGHSVVRIVKATYQVVSGSLTKIDVVLRKEGAAEKACSVRVWERPWLAVSDYKEITVSCEGEDEVKSRSRRSANNLGGLKIKGGPVAIPDPEHNEEVKSYVNDALASYNSAQYGSGHSVLRILNATKQTVSGSLTKINVVLQNGSAEKNCEIKVWNRAWIENGKEITVTCDQEESILKSI